MKKLGTTLLLALSLLSFTTACGKKDNTNHGNGYYNCGAGQYSQYGQCSGAYGQPGQYGQQQMCQPGTVSTQMGCLPQGTCPAGYGYYASQQGAWCIPQSYGQQQYNPYQGQNYSPYGGQYNPYQQQNPYGF